MYGKCVRNLHTVIIVERVEVIDLPLMIAVQLVPVLFVQEGLSVVVVDVVVVVSLLRQRRDRDQVESVVPALADAAGRRDCLLDVEPVKVFSDSRTAFDGVA